MKQWLLTKLGVKRAVHQAELDIIERVESLNVDADIRDEITEIVMVSLGKIVK